MKEIDDLMESLKITLSVRGLGSMVVDCACEAFGVEGERLVREALRAERDMGGFKNALIGETLGVARTTIGRWLGEISSGRQKNGDLTLNYFFQLCIAMGTEPEAAIPGAIDLENELIRAGMNFVNEKSKMTMPPLEPNQYPAYPEPRDHWGRVEELTLRLMNLAMGEELLAVGIKTDL